MRFPKWLKITVFVLLGLWLLFKFVGWPMMKKETKKISEEITNTYTKQGYDLSVNYSSPAKKGRVIFGALVPFDQVWRTGANEPTTFTTATDIKIIDKNLAKGTYSLWTIPGKEKWSIIFNKEVPEWGVTLISGGKSTTRDADADVLQVEVPIRELPSVQENFLIDFNNNNQLNLILSWDGTIIEIPINK